MRVGTLVNHENYFGVGIVTHIREFRGTRQYKVHWITEGRSFGWSWIDIRSVEVLCK